MEHCNLESRVRVLNHRETLQEGGASVLEAPPSGCFGLLKDDCIWGRRTESARSRKGYLQSEQEPIEDEVMELELSR